MNFQERSLIIQLNTLTGLISPNNKYLDSNKNLDIEKLNKSNEPFKFQIYNNRKLSRELTCDDKRIEQLITIYAYYKTPVKLMLADNKIISVQDNTNLEKLISTIDNDLAYKNLTSSKDFYEARTIIKQKRFLEKLIDDEVKVEIYGKNPLKNEREYLDKEEVNYIEQKYGKPSEFNNKPTKAKI